MRKKWFFCDAVNTLFPKADSFQKYKYWSRSIAKRRLKYAIFSYKFLANQKVK